MHQEKYSIAQLLLRSFLGIFYIGIPHFILLWFYSLYLIVCQLIAFFAVLINQKYPKFAFDAVAGYFRWSLRVSASLANLVDGYPPFGPNVKWNNADFELAYPEIITRKRILFATFLGAFVTIPHQLVIMVRQFVNFFIYFIAFFSVLFTRDYPEDMHNFYVGTLRLQYRTTLYMYGLYFKYPEFEGKETEVDRLHV